MFNLEIDLNFSRLKKWNGEGKIQDIFEEAKNGVGSKRCITELEMDKILSNHPLLVIFATKGFRHVDVIRHGFNSTVDSVSKVMEKLMTAVNEPNFDIGVFIGNEEISLRNVIVTCFIMSEWFHEMRFNLTHGSYFEKQNFFSSFFIETIDLSYYDKFEIDLCANLISQKIIDLKSDNLGIIDRNGSLLCKILNKFNYPVNIGWFDKNQEVNLWHSLIFPGVEYYGDMLTNENYELAIKNNTVIYLNFNEDSFNEDELIQFVRKFAGSGNLQQLVISFSVKDENYKYLYTLIKFFEYDMKMKRLSTHSYDSLTYYHN